MLLVLGAPVKYPVPPGNGGQMSSVIPLKNR